MTFLPRQTLVGCCIVLALDMERTICFPSSLYNQRRPKEINVTKHYEPHSLWTTLTMDHTGPPFSTGFYPGQVGVRGQIPTLTRQTALEIILWGGNSWKVLLCKNCVVDVTAEWESRVARNTAGPRLSGRSSKQPSSVAYILTDTPCHVSSVCDISELVAWFFFTCIYFQVTQ